MNIKPSKAVDDKAKIHSHALVDENVEIGARTRVWAFAHILSGAKIGEDCNICDHTFIESKVVLGDRVTVKCGVYLWDGVTAENDVFIGPAVVFTNDLKPRSRHYPESFEGTVLKEGCSIGANATILCSLALGAWSLIGCGSVVTKDVPDYAAVWGNPAKFQYWICKCTRKMTFDENFTYVCQCNASYVLDPKNKTVKNTTQTINEKDILAEK